MNWLQLISTPRSALSSSGKPATTRADASRLPLAALLTTALATSACSSPVSSGTTEAAPEKIATPLAPEPATRLQMRPDLPSEQLKDMFKGTLVKQLAFADRDGQGLLLLSQSEATLQDDPSEQPIDQITLRAEQFVRSDANAAWTSRWKVEQPTECEGLDLEVGYFPDQTRATDLDADGQAELTFATHSYCGGGIDPQQLRIDLRQGDRQHYVVRGESVVEVEGEPAFGGERLDEPEVASAPAPIRAHLDEVWSAIKRGSAD